MAETTKIQWCDHTASPWHGCTKIADGCDNCYAARQAVRNPGTLGIWGDDGVRVKSKSFIKNLRAWNKQAEAAGNPVTVFPSICDPFEDRPELVPWRREMFAVADECPWVILLLLTKRPGNIFKLWAGKDHIIGLRNNVWIGTSVACRQDLMNLEFLRDCRGLSPVLFVSAEPLIEDLGKVHLGCIDWLIIGGESGPHARPCDVDWIRSLRDQCQAGGVPVFVKQVGSLPVGGLQMTPQQWRLREPKGGDPSEWPADLRVREFPKVEAANV